MTMFANNNNNSKNNAPSITRQAPPHDNPAPLHDFHPEIGSSGLLVALTDRTERPDVGIPIKMMRNCLDQDATLQLLAIETCSDSTNDKKHSARLRATPSTARHFARRPSPSPRWILSAGSVLQEASTSTRAVTNWPAGISSSSLSCTPVRFSPGRQVARSGRRGLGDAALLLLLLVASAGPALNHQNVADRLPTTMSITGHQHQHQASPFGAHLEPEVEAETTPNNKQQTTDWLLHIRAEPISASGALALHRLPAGQHQASGHLHQAVAGADEPARMHTNQLHQNPTNQSQKCPPSLFAPGRGPMQSGLASGGGLRRQTTASPPLPPAQVVEVLAVEGSSLRLNFVITGQQQPSARPASLQPTSGSAKPGSGGPLPAAPVQLKVSWSRLVNDGSAQMVLINSGDTASAATTSSLNNVQQHQTQSSAKAASSGGAKVSSFQLAYERDPDTIRHLLGLEHQTGSIYMATSDRNDDSTNNDANQYAADETNNILLSNITKMAPSEHLLANQQHFLLGPFVAKQLLARLEQGHLSSNARQAVSMALRRANQQHSSAPNYLMLDDFLGDGQAIDWHKLGAYLRHLWSRSSMADGLQSQCPTTGVAPNDDHLQLQQQLVTQGPQQLLIVQLNLDRLTLADRGQYQLNVCQLLAKTSAQLSDKSAGADLGPSFNCGPTAGQPQLVVSLQLAEDVPRLESWFEPQLLDPGDRLSIKCEATGFTLPQISWFLDGQQLSESTVASVGQQQQQLSQKLPTHLLDNLATFQHTNPQQLLSQHLAISSYFRIGDYVSQDNHVHSFVNSSSLKSGDGGYYKCQANNGFHLVEHEARIDVRGVPVISRRLISNVSALIGAPKLEIQCPYSGYPISSIEWFFKPILQADSRSQPTSGSSINNQPFQRSLLSPSDYPGPSLSMEAGDPSSSPFVGGGAGDRYIRIRPRRAGASFQAKTSIQSVQPPTISDDDQQQQQLESDEWLDQAIALTGSPPSPDDYPEPMPDDPAPFGQSERAPSQGLARIMDPGADMDPDPEEDQDSDLDPDHQSQGTDVLLSAGGLQSEPAMPITSGLARVSTARASRPGPMMLFDYSDTQMDFQQQQETDDGSFEFWSPQSLLLNPDENPYGIASHSRGQSREKRSTQQHEHKQQQRSVADNWIKLPQSRRHQVHPNGTLAISDISRQDHGLYRCQVSGPGGSSRQQQQQSAPEELQSSMMMGLGEAPSGGSGSASDNSQQFSDQPHSMTNEMQLNVLVPPAISPFASSDSLREGMRNFLSCSVIEGDAPVRLHWLKDGRPLEDHILMSNQQQQQHQHHHDHHQQPSSSSRIRVETSNEYTSTIYFSQVEFGDNGNYTCIATNKAASVNYTTKMLVNVPPRWTKSPKDVDCVAGQSIVIDCQAEGHPSPRIWWEIGLSPSTQMDASSASNKPQQELQMLSRGADKIGDKLALNSVVSSALVANRPAGGSQIIDGNGNTADHTQPTSVSSAQMNNAANSHVTSISPHQQHPPTHYRTIISNSRIHILENASLVIRDVVKQDQGYYLCQASNNFGLVSSLIKLTVNVGASFSGKYLLKYVKLNERVELDCDPSGQSPVTVTWLMRGATNVPQTSHNQTYSMSSGLTSSAADHHGHYQVYPQHQPASNQSAATHDGRRLFVGPIKTLEVMPSVASSGLSSAVGAAAAPSAGSQANLQQQQQLVDIDSNMSFEVVKRRSPMMLGAELVRMHIKQARRSHSGDYVCLASNQFGSDERLMKLVVQEVPDPVNELSAVHKESRSISLAWSVPFNGNSPISSYLVEWAPLASSGGGGLAATGNHLMVEDLATLLQSSAAANNDNTGASSKSSRPLPSAAWSHSISQQPAITINSLQPETSYEIRVRARNQFGLSALPTNSEPFVVSTGEEAPGAPPGDVRAIPLSSSSLQVSWLAPTTVQPQVGGAGDTLALASQSSQLSPTAQAAPRSSGSIKGYYLGYRISGGNESFVFKTVSHLSSAPLGTAGASNHLGQHAANGSTANHLQSGPQRLRANIDELKRATRYTIIVQAFNMAGSGPQSDQVEAKTLVADPPPAPQLRVGLASFASIELQWYYQLTTSTAHLADDQSPLDTGGPTSGNQAPEQHPSKRNSQTGAGSAPTIDGYHLYYRAAELGGDWLERKLSPETHALIAGGTGMGHPPTNDHPRQAALQGNSQQLRVGAGSASEQQHQSTWSLVELQAAIHHQLAMDSANGQGQAPDAAGSGADNKMRLRQQLQSSWQRFANQTSSEYLLHQRTFNYLLDQLNCGTAYQIYLVAYNAFGTGEPSHILRAKTRGSTPIKPRRQEFLTINSTQVQLNLDSWLDGGCSVNNFEIRYKQLVGGQAEALALMGAPSGGSVSSIAGGHSYQYNSQPHPPRQVAPKSDTGANNTNWLLLSSNISPMQRSIELRDLQAETWYAILASAESSAGKTDAHYAFMTLDKRGQVPSEALEMQQQLLQIQLQMQQQQQQQANNAPALIRGSSAGGSLSQGSSIRSIWLGLNQPGNSLGLLSPLLVSACICVILFATCSLLLIRRYNNLIKDNVSIDSRTTSGALSSVAHFGTSQLGSTANRNHYHHSHNHQHQLQAGHHLFANSGSAGAFAGSASASGSPINNHHHQHLEHYSMKVSPCKTGTSTLLATGHGKNGANLSQHSSSANSNGSSSAAMLLNGSTCGDSGGSSSAYVATTSALNNVGPMTGGLQTDAGHQQHPDHNQQEQQVDLGHFLMASDQVFCRQQAASAINNNNNNYSTPADATMTNASKQFATLSHHHNNHHSQHPQQQQSHLHQMANEQLQSYQQQVISQQQYQQAAAQFKTLPHLSSATGRPLSNYLPTFQGAINATCPLISGIDNQQLAAERSNMVCQDHQHSNECQQQIYAKLRSIQHQQQMQYATASQQNDVSESNICQAVNSADSNLHLQQSSNGANPNWPANGQPVNYGGDLVTDTNSSGHLLHNPGNSNQHLASPGAQNPAPAGGQQQPEQQDDYALPFPPKWV